MDNRTTVKRELFLGLMRIGQVSVYVDARRPDVIVPARFKTEKALLLEYGYEMPVPIVDLAVSDDGIAAVLSFDRRGSLTFVPWAAVFMIMLSDPVTGHVGKHWKDDMPTEEAAAPAPPPRHLRSV